MTTKDQPSLLARVFAYKATRVVLFVAAVGLFTVYLLNHAQQNGGITTGIEADHNVVELDARTAETIFNPTLENLQPKPFYLLICDKNDMACQLQMKETERAAGAMKDDVLFYHLDPNANKAVYNAIYKVISQMAGKPIPQAFPMHTLWKTGFQFKGTVPTAGVGIAGLAENMFPAGRVVAWITEALNPPADEGPAQAAPAPDKGQTQTAPGAPKAAPKG